jgi:hypothetical protein
VLELVPDLAARDTQSQGKRLFGLGRKTLDESYCGSFRVCTPQPTHGEDQAQHAHQPPKPSSRIKSPTTSMQLFTRLSASSTWMTLFENCSSAFVSVSSISLMPPAFLGMTASTRPRARDSDTKRAAASTTSSVVARSMPASITRPMVGMMGVATKYGQMRLMRTSLLCASGYSRSDRNQPSTACLLVAPTTQPGGGVGPFPAGFAGNGAAPAGW